MVCKRFMPWLLLVSFVASDRPEIKEDSNTDETLESSSVPAQNIQSLIENSYMTSAETVSAIKSKVQGLHDPDISKDAVVKALREQKRNVNATQFPLDDVRTLFGKHMIPTMMHMLSSRSEALPDHTNTEQLLQYQNNAFRSRMCNTLTDEQCNLVSATNIDDVDDVVFQNVARSVTNSIAADFTTNLRDPGTNKQQLLNQMTRVSFHDQMCGDSSKLTELKCDVIFADVLDAIDVVNQLRERKQTLNVNSTKSPLRATRIKFGRDMLPMLTSPFKESNNYNGFKQHVCVDKSDQECKTLFDSDPVAVPENLLADISVTATQAIAFGFVQEMGGEDPANDKHSVLGKLTRDSFFDKICKRAVLNKPECDVIFGDALDEIVSFFKRSAIGEDLDHIDSFVKKHSIGGSSLPIIEKHKNKNAIGGSDEHSGKGGDDGNTGGKACSPAAFSHILLLAAVFAGLGA